MVNSDFILSYFRVPLLSERLMWGQTDEGSLMSNITYKNTSLSLDVYGKEYPELIPRDILVSFIHEAVSLYGLVIINIIIVSETDAISEP